MNHSKVSFTNSLLKSVPIFTDTKGSNTCSRKWNETRGIWMEPPDLNSPSVRNYCLHCVVEILGVCEWS